ncbi:hypothetical protein PHMEG_00023018 [Phytophthora megakarya]|uniref:Uncharacterized protein n=1 Tax=Phytophthora megakarya TaxID=4795 RepID=A0A225VHC1_9STRA|nr:hypothetical protein PHMEG_00023018 [Phytophthora megakarya]
MDNGTGYVSAVAASCSPQVDSRRAPSTDRWMKFLQLYEPFITRELTQKHPQFAFALRQLERETRLEQDRQNAQVLATLRLKDARICELQKMVKEQHEQLDVVLDELERRETKEDKQVQVGGKTQKEDASVQTVSDRRHMETQTEQNEEESGVLGLLEKLENELKTLEEKNVKLESELQQKVFKDEVMEDSEEMKNCLEILQRGVDAMNLSCGCVDNPLMYIAGVLDTNYGKDSSTMSACVNLEHRLEAQAVRLEHAQECLYMWRDATVRMMQQQNEPNRAVEQKFSTSLAIRHDKEDFAEISCLVALRGALSQIRQYLFQRRRKNYNGSQCDWKELANVLAKGKRGTKIAAKMVRKWAGWETKHLEEVRALRQGFNEERIVAQNRRVVLLKRITMLEQQELELQTEVNVLKKKYKFQDGKNSTALTVSSPTLRANELPVKTDKCGKLLEYPQMALRLATAEQSLLAKDEQLTAANDTIRALSSGTMAPTHMSSPNTLLTRSDVSMNQLDIKLQRSSQQKLEFFQRREKDLVSLDQYFRMEKRCLQLQTQLGAEQKHMTMMKAAIDVCEQERDELLMRVEKLETESMLFGT